MRTSWFLVATITVAAALAGCSDGGSKDDGDDPKPPVTATEDTGILYGVVTDMAITPIKNVKITLIGPPGEDGQPSQEEGQTDELGEFSFDQLLPGPWLLKAEKGGYFPGQATVIVEAGEDEPDPVLLKLGEDAANRPYSFTFTQEGLFSCAFGGGVDGVVSGTVPCAQPATSDMFPDDVAQFNYTLDRMPTLVQVELSWENTQPANSWMVLSVAHPTDDNVAHPDFWDDLQVEGPPPVLPLRVEDPTVLSKYLIEGWGLNATDPPQLQIRVFPTADNGNGPVLTAQQTFTVYTSVFYGYAPTADWLFTESGERPSPP